MRGTEYSRQGPGPSGAREQGFRRALAGPLLLGVCLAATGAPSVRGAANPLPQGLARNFTVRRWTLDDGLPDSQICGVVSGRDGYLWLATARFLVRFDGLRFLPVMMPAQAGSGRNEGLFQDSLGGLWVYGYQGAMRYADGEWRQGESAGLPRRRVLSVAEGADHAIFLALESAVLEWRDGRARQVLDASLFAGENGGFRQLACDGEGGLWLVFGESLYRCSPGVSDKPVRMTAKSAEWKLGGAEGRPLLAHGASFCLRREDDRWQPLPEARIQPARCLLELSDGTIWVGHDAGVDVLSGGVWHSQTQSVLYGPFRVLDMAVDRESNIWVATTEGLLRLRRRILQSVPLREGSGVAEVAVLWVGGDGRVLAGLRTGGLAAGDADGVEPLLVPPGFSDVALNALYREANGTLWCGGAGGSLWTLQNQSLLRIEGVDAEDVQAILGSGGAPSWVATRRGVLTFNADKNRLVEMSWPLDPVLTLWQDRDGVLWTGHESLGLAVLRPGKNGEFLPERELPGRTIRAIRRDSEGVLWAGGLSGLARWENGKSFVFRRSHGLWNESIRQIAEDACGFLWLGTAEGIMRIAKRDLSDVANGRKELLEVRTFGEEAGIDQTACAGGVFSPAGEPLRDRLWFPTRGGLLFVDTGSLPPSRPAPAVRFASVEGGSLVRVQGDTRAPVQKVPEPGNPQDVRVEFTALDFATPERVRFRYELEGPLNLRSGLTEERHVVFSRLPTGNYTFRVTACNGDGIWNPAGAVVSWMVRPFFWETAAFRLWCLLLVGGCVALVVRVFERQRVRRRLEAAERERELARERARIARDLHDEIGAKLTRLSLLGSMAAEDAKSDEALCREVEEMADTARETHRAFDEIVWSVSPRNDTVRSLSHYICKYAEEFFAGTPVSCICEVPERMPDQTLEPKCRHHFFLAVKECLHNSLKHAGATRVQITSEIADQSLRVAVSDNGCGFEPGVVGQQGEGLRNMQERMKAVAGRLEMVSRPGTGTRLTFEMPLEK